MHSLLLPIAVLSLAATSQTPKPIQAKDGDVVRLAPGARLRIVTAGDAIVRTIWSKEGYWLVVLADYARDGGQPDGRVDAAFTFFHLDGDWPLGERWEGLARVEQYSMSGPYQNLGIGMTTSAGLVQVLSSVQDRATAAAFREPSAIRTLGYNGAGMSGAGTFDEMEARAVASAKARVGAPPGAVGMIDNVPVTSPHPSQPPPPPGAPVRIGGTLKTPLKVHDVAPVMPALAQQAGIRGFVILDATIASDGSVADAKVLRSIPLLDQAAVAAVRQWRYEPTYLNGAPIPVIMTVEVSFK